MTDKHIRECGGAVKPSEMLDSMKDQTITELLPCPFCGVEPLLTHFGAHVFTVHCGNEDCAVGCETSATDHMQALETWNTRASQPRCDADLREAAIKECLRRIDDLRCIPINSNPERSAALTDVYDSLRALPRQAAAAHSGEEAGRAALMKALQTANHYCHRGSMPREAVEQIEAALASPPPVTEATDDVQAPREAPEQRLDLDMNLFNNARSEAFEEAAKIADRYRENTAAIDCAPGRDAACVMIAADIRALSRLSTDVQAPWHEALRLCEHAVIEGTRDLGLPSVVRRFEVEFEKLRAALLRCSTATAPALCQVCGEAAPLRCGPSRFGDQTWACDSCWNPEGVTHPSPTREAT